MKNRWSLWIAAIPFWSTLGMLFALPGLSSGKWGRYLLISLVQWWSWGLVTPLIVWIDAKLPFKENQLLKRILAHLPASVVVTVLYSCLVLALGALFRIQPWSAVGIQYLLVTLFPAFMWSWLVYWVIFAVQQTFRYYQHYLASELRVARIERSYSEARLKALRMQLDPHFLFNALNTVSSQVERNPRLARAMIEHLGDLLRLSLDARNRQEIPLTEEFAFLDHYVAIQRIRFAENLRFEIQIDPEVKYALIPSLIVQPLVENAIRHGISRRASGGTVAVVAQHRVGQLEIRVADDGVGLPTGWTLETSSGMGLSVTRERIMGLYPNGSSRFLVRRRSEGGTEVEISLPLRFAGESASG
jgi:two-component system, LytTR family, sensor kinase